MLQAMQTISLRARRALFALPIALCCLFLLSLPAQACGGIFISDSTRNKVSQDTERLLITVGKQQTTLYEEIRYKGSAQDFAWVLPVPVVPQVDTAPQNLFTFLEYMTEPRFVVPQTNDCDSVDITRSLFQRNGVGAGAPTSGSSVHVYSGGTVGPFAYEVIKGGSARELTDWLQGHHYAVPASTSSLIQPYVARNMYFLAMRLRPGENVSVIQPVKVTFPMVMQQITIPIRLAATDIQNRMNMEVSVIAPERYAPQNYKDVTIDPAQLTVSPDPGGNYNDLVNRAIEQAGGNAFITQYAHRGITSLKSYLDDMPADSYISRFYTSFTPQYMSVDPVLVPMSNLKDVDRYITLTDRSQPDCTSTYIKDAFVLAIFPGAPIVIALVGGVIWWRRRHRKSSNAE